MSIQRRKSTCPYRGFGCGLTVGVEGGKFVEVRGMKGHPVNDGDICALAANLPPVFTAMRRLTKPMIRRQGQLVPVGRFAWALAVAMTATLLIGCDSGERREIDLTDRISDTELSEMVPERDPDVLRFGFDVRAGPREDARQYVPFLEYLEEATGHRFELRFSREDAHIVDDLGTGVVQFAAIGAGSFLRARARYGIIPLVRGVNAQGRPEYQSVIVVAPDSPIREIEDLRGKRFAFANVTSTQGHLIPRIVLESHGLSLEDLAGYEYTGSHERCATAVSAGRFDAGGMQDTLARRLAEAGLIRIIHTSKFYPSSGIAANKDVPAEILEEVKQALLDFQPTGRDAARLYHWDRTEMSNGFVEAHDEDYAELHEWARKFGLLDEPPKGQEP